MLEVRHDVPLDLVRRPEAVHLYGVDVMSTEDCMSYFGDYGPTHVEWIDDSSCNVVFADPASAQRAIVGLGRPLSPDLFPDSAGRHWFSLLQLVSPCPPFAVPTFLPWFWLSGFAMPTFCHGFRSCFAIPIFCHGSCCWVCRNQVLQWFLPWVLPHPPSAVVPCQGNGQVVGAEGRR